MFYEEINPMFIGEKRCKVCGETKGKSEFNRHPETADGLHSYCRECDKKRTAAERQRNREANSKRDPFDGSMKWCPKCKTDLPRTRDHWLTDQTRKDGLQGHCHLCLSAKNSDLIDRIDRLWRWERGKKRTKRRGDWIDHGKAEWLDLVVLQRCTCPLTGERLTVDNVSIDHIVPISKGGTNELSNLRLVSSWANNALGSGTDEELFRHCQAYVNRCSDPYDLPKSIDGVDLVAVAKRLKTAWDKQVWLARWKKAKGSTNRVDSTGFCGESQPLSYWVDRVQLVNGHCPYSGHVLTAANASPDHIVPLSNGGSNKMENVTITTKEFNVIKASFGTEELFVRCCKVVKTLSRQYR